MGQFLAQEFFNPRLIFLLLAKLDLQLLCYTALHLQHLILLIVVGKLLFFNSVLAKLQKLGFGFSLYFVYCAKPMKHRHQCRGGGFCYSSIGLADIMSLMMRIQTSTCSKFWVTGNLKANFLWPL